MLVNSITTKITKNRRKLSRFLKKLHKKIKVKSQLAILSLKYNIGNNNLNNTNSFILNSLKYKHTYGFRIEAKGRLTRRYTASRSKFVSKYKGSLANLDSSYKGLSSVILKGNLKSNIQYTMLKSKTRIGSFGIKG